MKLDTSSMTKKTNTPVSTPLTATVEQKRRPPRQVRKKGMSRQEADDAAHRRFSAPRWPFELEVAVAASARKRLRRTHKIEVLWTVTELRMARAFCRSCRPSIRNRLVVPA